MTKKKDTHRQIGVLVPERLMEKLDLRKQATSIPFSSQVLEALHEYFERLDAKEAQKLKA